MLWVISDVQSMPAENREQVLRGFQLLLQEENIYKILSQMA